MNSDALTVVDPRTERPIKTIRIPTPYNLYFTPDGSKAIVVEDFTTPGGRGGNGLRFYDRRTWKFLQFVPIPFPGADHLDFSADGRYLFLSCEYSGEVERVDTRTMKVSGSVYVGGLPIDVRLAPATQRRDQAGHAALLDVPTHHVAQAAEPGRRESARAHGPSPPTGKNSNAIVVLGPEAPA